MNSRLRRERRDGKPNGSNTVSHARDATSTGEPCRFAV
jgi:hypothetical protein